MLYNSFRFFDITFAIVGIIMASPLLLFAGILASVETGSPLFTQVRLGKNKNTFVLFKFRSMKIGTQSLPTHFANEASITNFGRVLRKTKLDELPQLLNVLLGDMSLVGPRPCLPSQKELVEERDSRGVFSVRPGITGLAQVQGVDMSDPVKLARIDQQMIQGMTLRCYFQLLFLTLGGKGQGDRLVRRK